MKRILIVEDDTILAQEWKEEIEQSTSYQVDVVSNSIAATPLLESKMYDGFILDLFYERDGTFEPIGGIRLIPIIKKLKATPQSPLIIAVTGHYYDDARVSTGDVLQTLGVEHILQKPVDIRELMDLISMTMA